MSIVELGRPGTLVVGSIVTVALGVVGMAADLEEKTDRYEGMLADALSTAEVAVPSATPLGRAADEIGEMALSYLEDGRHFRGNDDLVNALAAFSYGYGWLDAGVRLGLFEVPEDTDLFTIE